MSELFSFHQITGTLAGGNIAADPTPSNTAPATGRAVRIKRRREVQQPSQGLTVVALDGTTITATPWVWDDTLGVWWQLAAGKAATPAAPAIFSGFTNLDGALVFVQLTANTGVTCAGWYYG